MPGGDDSDLYLQFSSQVVDSNVELIDLWWKQIKTDQYSGFREETQSRE